MHLSKSLSLSCFFSALLIGCGGSSGGSSSSNGTSNVSIGFSDYPVQDAEQVVITVDSISFMQDGELTVVDSFTSTDLDIEDADTFEIDLLSVRDNDFKLVLDSVTLPVGEYTDLRIEILDENTELSYVKELGSADGEVKELKVPSDELKLGSFTVDELSTQTFIIEFDLSQAMTYNPGPERYILKPRGVRIVGLESAATLSGNVDLAAVHLESVCSEKADQTLGNAVYLYPARAETDVLADAYDPDAEENAEVVIDENALAPYAVAPVAENGDYFISFIQPGAYTLAFSCLAEGDDPTLYQVGEGSDIVIPAPATEIVDLVFVDDEAAYCGFPLTDGACATAP